MHNLKTTNVLNNKTDYFSEWSLYYVTNQNYMVPILYFKRVKNQFCYINSFEPAL